MINPFRRRGADKVGVAAAYTKRYREWALMNCDRCLTPKLRPIEDLHAIAHGYVKYKTPYTEIVQGSPVSCMCCGTAFYVCTYCLVSGQAYGDGNDVCTDCGVADD